MSAQTPSLQVLALEASLFFHLRAIDHQQQFTDDLIDHLGGNHRQSIQAFINGLPASFDITDNKPPEIIWRLDSTSPNGLCLVLSVQQKEDRQLYLVSVQKIQQYTFSTTFGLN